MIYIIEGIDGSGKSTLAQQLARQTHAEIIHMSYPKTQEEKDDMFHEYASRITKKNLIFDRSWYSEMAYGPVMRDKSYISFLQMYALERMIVNAGGGMIMHCTGAPSTLWARAQRRGEDYVICRDDFDKIYFDFKEIMKAPHIIPVVTYEVPD